MFCDLEIFNVNIIVLLYLCFPSKAEGKMAQHKLNK